MSSSVKEEGILDFTHKRLAYLIQRPKQQSSVALVIASHGFGGCKEGRNHFAEKLAAVLSRSNIALLTYDFRGSGKSSSHLKHMQLEDFTEDLKDIIEFALTLPYVDRDKVALHGTSFGGLITSLTLRDYAHLIKALSFVAPVAYGKTWLEIYQDYLSEAKSDEELVPFYDHRLKKSFVQAFLEARGDSSLHHFAKDTPALLIYPTQDQVIPIEHAKAYESSSNCLSIKLVEGADHSFSSLDKQEEMIQQLYKFYASIFSNS
ncbi:MAG: lysophospholipase [Chlamydiales bacterium]|nr:lysophospholipase [Chlamydiales bacterium]